MLTVSQSVTGDKRRGYDIGPSSGKDRSPLGRAFPAAEGEPTHFEKKLRRRALT